MVRLKKIFAVTLAILGIIVMLVSCVREKATPEESTKIFLDVILKDDKTNMNRIGIKKEDYSELKKNQEDNAMKCFGELEIGNNIINDEIKSELKENILKGISKISYEVVLESTEENTAKVIVKIKTFNMDSIIREGEDKIKEKYSNNSSMTQREIIQSYLKTVGELMASGTVKEEPSIVTITLNKKDNVWQPDDNAEVDVINAVIGR